MPRNPIADDSGEFADLSGEAAVVPRRDAKRIFIQTNLSAVIAGVEPSIKSRLRKEINVRADLCIKKQHQTRVEEIVDLAVDESGGGLLEMINFDVDCAAQSCPKIVLERSDSEGAIEPIKKIF